MTSTDRSGFKVRVPYLTVEDLEVADRDVLEREINLFRALAHSPLAARRFNAVGKFIRHESRLPARLRQLAILQVGYSTRSLYEYSHHIKISREFGLTDDEIAAVSQESEGRPSCLGILERNVLMAAREMTANADLSGEVFVRLKGALDSEEIVDLILTIAFYNAVIRILNALRIDVEPEYMKYLVQFPLPELPG